MARSGSVVLGLSLVASVVHAACDSESLTPEAADAGAAGVAIAEGGGDGGSESECWGGGGATPTSGGGQGNEPASGQGGEAGEIGVSGAPSVAPFFQDCDGQPIELDTDWVRFCVLVGSCVSDSFSIGACIQSPGSLAVYHFSSPLAQPPLDQAAPWMGAWDFSACPKSITSCADVVACADETFAVPSESCEELGQAHCDAGGSRTYCSPDGILYKAPACNLQSNFECTILEAQNVDDLMLGCVPPGCTDMHSSENSGGCDGDDYEFGDGYWSMRLHCPDYGFATCRDGVCADEL